MININNQILLNTEKLCLCERNLFIAPLLQNMLCNCQKNVPIRINSQLISEPINHIYYMPNGPHIFHLKEELHKANVLRYQVNLDKYLTNFNQDSNSVVYINYIQTLVNELQQFFFKDIIVEVNNVTEANYFKLKNKIKDQFECNFKMYYKNLNNLISENAGIIKSINPIFNSNINQGLALIIKYLINGEKILTIPILNPMSIMDYNKK